MGKIVIILLPLVSLRPIRIPQIVIPVHVVLLPLS